MTPSAKQAHAARMLAHLETTMTDEINTLDDFREACVRHDLTHGYSDDGEVWRRGCAQYDRIRKAAEKFPRADVERIWNEVVDTKLIEEARAQFYWRWPQPAVVES